MTTKCILEGIEKLRKLPDPNATSGSSGGDGITLWRGMCDVQVKEKFFQTGGTERAFMSTSRSLEKAVNFALQEASKDTPVLLLKLRAKSSLMRGVSLEFLTRFSGEEEYLYPPCTFLYTTGKTQKVECMGIDMTVVEVEPQFPISLI